MNKEAILITIYPPRYTTFGKGVGGVASYAKNTVKSTQNVIKYIVLAQTIDDKKETYEEDVHTIIRCWKRGSLTYIPIFIAQLLKNRSKTDTLMIQFEFAIYGGEYITGFFPIVLIFARLLGYKITLVQHQVVTNLSELSGHLSLKGTKMHIYNFLMSNFIKTLLILPQKIVVFDQIHKNKLQAYNAKIANKTHVIPHGVEKYGNSPMANTRHKDNKAFNILMFGFIAKYKGSLLGLEHFAQYIKNNPQSRFRLILAGDQSPTQKDNPAYQEYYQKALNLAKKTPGVTHTGFVPEEEIDLLHQEADLVLLPYETLMSSSGPLSIAIKHRKPFLLSDVLEPYTLTEDFQKAIKEYFTDQYPVIRLEEGNVFDQIEEVVKNQSTMRNLERVSERLYESRNWEAIGKEYLNLIKEK